MVPSERAPRPDPAGNSESSLSGAQRSSSLTLFRIALGRVLSCLCRGARCSWMRRGRQQAVVCGWGDGGRGTECRDKVAPPPSLRQAAQSFFGGAYESWDGWHGFAVLRAMQAGDPEHARARVRGRAWWWTPLAGRAGKKTVALEWLLSFLSVGRGTSPAMREAYAARDPPRSQAPHPSHVSRLAPPAAARPL